MVKFVLVDVPILLGVTHFIGLFWVHFPRKISPHFIVLVNYRNLTAVWPDYVSSVDTGLTLD